MSADGVHSTATDASATAATRSCVGGIGRVVRVVAASITPERAPAPNSVTARTEIPLTAVCARSPASLCAAASLGVRSSASGCPVTV